jgi:hypothetical protein
MDISTVGQSVGIVRNLLKEVVAPGIDELRNDMCDLHGRMDSLENAVACLDGRMDGISANLVSISTSLAQLPVFL